VGFTWALIKTRKQQQKTEEEEANDLVCVCVLLGAGCNPATPTRHFKEERNMHAKMCHTEILGQPNEYLRPDIFF
jgi:hypothetical protein